MRYTLLTRQSGLWIMAVLATICLVYFSRIHVKSLGAKPQGMILSGVPQVPDSICRSMARYQSWNSCAFQDWTADGKSMVVITRSGQTNQVHIVDSKKAAPRQITSFSEPVTSACVCPNPSRQEMLFEKDSGGNENFQIFSADLNAGQPRLQTGGDRATQNTGALWSNAGDRFAFVSNKRNGIDFDIYISDLKAARLVLARPGSWSCLDWSPDDTRLLVERFRSRTESFIAVLDLESGQCTPLSDTSDTVSEESAVWAQDGRGIFLTSDQGSLFRTLRYYDCATRRQTVLTRDIAWDVREIAVSRDRKKLAFMTNENGFSRVYIMNTATLVFRELPGLPLGGIYHLRFDPSGGSLGMTIGLPQHPEECYAVNLDDFSCDRWTASSMGGLDTGALISPHLIQYPTFDSLSGKPRMVPCFFYRPRIGDRQGPFPVIITVHGGPESQFWPYFSAAIQYFVNELGVAVLAPNVRGSGGYGKEYLQLDNGRRREDAVRDIGCLLDWIATQESLDTSRVCIMGGSYGGYVALSAMEHFGSRISCGIDLYGISNFVTFLEHTSAYRQDLRRAEYGDERDVRMRTFLNAISPLSRASLIAKPLFIIQGANDPRVPLEESVGIAAAVRKNKGAVWMLVAPDEGHGFRKKANIDYQECLEEFFLRTFLVRP
jgi:Tol biopolymer transport system component/acetyl esterase/lipase